MVGPWQGGTQCGMYLIECCGESVLESEWLPEAVQSYPGPLCPKSGSESSQLWHCSGYLFGLTVSYFSNLQEGQLTLRNLKLKKGALDKFQLPVDVLAGECAFFIRQFISCSQLNLTQVTLESLLCRFIG